MPQNYYSTIDIYSIFDKLSLSYDLVKKLLIDNKIDLLINKLKEEKNRHKANTVINVLNDIIIVSLEDKKKIAIRLFNETKDLIFVCFLLENNLINEREAKNLIKKALYISNKNKFEILIKKLNYFDYKDFVFKIKNKDNSETLFDFFIKSKKNSADEIKSISISIFNLKDLYNIIKENKLKINQKIINKLKENIEYKKTIELATTEFEKALINFYYLKFDKLSDKELLKIIEELKGNKIIIEKNETKKFINTIKKRIKNKNFLNNCLFFLWPDWIIKGSFLEIIKSLNFNYFKSISKNESLKCSPFLISESFLQDLIDKELAYDTYKRTKNIFSLMFSNFSIKSIFYDPNIDEKHKPTLVFHFAAKEIAQTDLNLNNSYFLKKLNEKKLELSELIRANKIDLNLLNELLNLMIFPYIKYYLDNKSLEIETASDKLKFEKYSKSIRSFIFLKKDFIKLNTTPYYFLISSLDEIAQLLDSNLIDQIEKERFMILYSIKEKNNQSIYDLFFKTKNFVCSEMTLELITNSNKILKELKEIMLMRINKSKNTPKKKRLL